jgi:hypothetical protein
MPLIASVSFSLEGLVWSTVLNAENPCGRNEKAKASIFARTSAAMLHSCCTLVNKVKPGSLTQDLHGTKQQECQRMNHIDTP